MAWVTVLLFTTNQIIIALASEWMYQMEVKRSLAHLVLASCSMVVYCCFLAVTIPYSAYFGAIFLLNVGLCGYRFDPLIMKPLYGQCGAFSVGLICMHYVLLRRELRRFFQQRKLERSES